MEARLELLVRMYEVQMKNARHTENQRATITNFVILIAGALVAVLQATGDTQAWIILSAMIVGLGLYGALIVYKLYERFMYHIHQALQYVGHIDSLVEGISIHSVIRDSEHLHNQRFSPKWLIGFRLHRAWLAINLFIALAGLLLLLVAISST